MDEQLEFIKLVVERLDAAGIPYMMTGSMAMSIYAVPRMTRDVDFVIECTPDDAPRIVELFQADCYVDESRVRRATQDHSTFNIIHNKWITKADFIVLKEEEYRRVEFGRRQRIDLGGVGVFVVRPEDLILSKLSWSLNGESELQLRDAASLCAGVPDLDWAYLKKWAGVLGLIESLEKVTPE
ncbi:MAG: hypothetical protein ABIK85_07590 [Candidatus Eisenbacteria bacterium]